MGPGLSGAPGGSGVGSPRRAVLRSRPPEAEMAVLEPAGPGLGLAEAAHGPGRAVGPRTSGCLAGLWGFPGGSARPNGSPGSGLPGCCPNWRGPWGRSADGRGIPGVAHRRGPAGLTARTGDPGSGDSGPGPPGDAGSGLFPRLLPGPELRDPAAPPRPLPLLYGGKNRPVLGGTYQSQHHFAGELFNNLLGAAPEIVLTRPADGRRRRTGGQPLFPGEWEPRDARC